MRRWAISLAVFMAACEVIPQTAPITYKTSQADGVFIDGVELSVLCELAKHLGSDYRAADVSEEDAVALEDKRVFLDLLDTEGATCGRESEPLGLPFVADTERQIVSTWSDFSTEADGDRWGSCIADSTRPVGKRVVYCEISEGPQTELTSPDFNLTPEPEETTPQSEPGDPDI